MEKGQGKRTDTLHRDNDYLRRGDVKRLLENVVCLHEELPAQIDLLPAADVVPVRHGKWETAFLAHEYLGCRPYAHYCSVCHQIIAFRTFYCPNCGADMREES